MPAPRWKISHGAESMASVWGGVFTKDDKHSGCLIFPENRKRTVNVIYEMPSFYEDGTSVTLSIVWSKPVPGPGSVTWCERHMEAVPGEACAGWSDWAIGAENYDVDDSSIVQLCTFPDISIPRLSKESILFVQICRDPAHDGYAERVNAMSFDLEYTGIWPIHR